MISLFHFSVMDIIVVVVVVLFSIVVLALVIAEKVGRRVKRFFKSLKTPDDRGAT